MKLQRPTDLFADGVKMSPGLFVGMWSEKVPSEILISRRCLSMTSAKILKVQLRSFVSRLMQM